jgi:hypothetical protein
MSIRRKRDWELPESAATPEQAYLDRRRLLGAIGVGGAILAVAALLRMGVPDDTRPQDAAAGSAGPRVATQWLRDDAAR